MAYIYDITWKAVNQPVYSLPINVVQTNNSYKQCYMCTKDVVCAVLGKPHYEGSRGHINSKMSQTKILCILLESGSDGDVMFVKKGSNGIQKLNSLSHKHGSHL